MTTLILLIALAAEPGYPVKVERVIDGDTFVADVTLYPGIVLDDQRIRLTVYAPELSDGLGDGQDAMEAAKGWLEQRMKARQTFRFLPHGKTGRDKYGRLLGDILCGEESLSEWLVKEGRAWRSPVELRGLMPPETHEEQIDQP